MSPQSIVDQVEAWLSYSRRGPLNLSDWMETKGYTREDRQQFFRALSARITR
jgi:hypothetical protein